MRGDALSEMNLKPIDLRIRSTLKWQYQETVTQYLEEIVAVHMMQKAQNFLGLVQIAKAASFLTASVKAVDNTKAALTRLGKQKLNIIFCLSLKNLPLCW